MKLWRARSSAYIDHHYFSQNLELVVFCHSLIYWMLVADRRRAAAHGRCGDLQTTRSVPS